MIGEAEEMCNVQDMCFVKNPLLQMVDDAEESDGG